MITLKFGGNYPKPGACPELEPSKCTVPPRDENPPA